MCKQLNAVIIYICKNRSGCFYIFGNRELPWARFVYKDMNTVAIFGFYRTTCIVYRDCGMLCWRIARVDSGVVVLWCRRYNMWYNYLE